MACILMCLVYCLTNRSCVWSDDDLKLLIPDSVGREDDDVKLLLPDSLWSDDDVKLLIPDGVCQTPDSRQCLEWWWRQTPDSRQCWEWWPHQTPDSRQCWEWWWHQTSHSSLVWIHENAAAPAQLKLSLARALPGLCKLYASAWCLRTWHFTVLNVWCPFR